MKTYVYINFKSKTINVDYETFVLSFTKDLLTNLPENITYDDFDAIAWHSTDQNNRFIPLKNGEAYLYDVDKYDLWIKPYVNLWQAEKDRLEQEEEEAEAERNKFENRQARALTQLNEDFEPVKERAHLKSSLGFEVDANSTAKENVQGLIEEVGTSTVEFCDYYNQFHELNKAQLETLKSEINQNGQALYAQKWQYRTAIEACTDNEELDAVVAGIEFTYMDFTPKDETDEGTTETDQTTDGATE